MSTSRRTGSGGFGQAITFIISVVALIFSIMAYRATQKETNIEESINDLKENVENIKRESSKQIDKLRGETANALEKMSTVVKKKK